MVRSLDGRKSAHFSATSSVCWFSPPFEDWRFARLRHHVTYANLDARGFGDIWTMTLTEYENASKKKRLQYRLYRNPVVMLGLGALFMFLLTICLLCRGGFPVISGNTMSTI